MRIAQADTAIGAFHAHKGSGRAGRQREAIVAFIKSRGGDWSIGELAQALGMEKSTVSARVNEALTETGELTARPKRRDRCSGVLIRPVAIPPLQGDLFQ